MAKRINDLLEKYWDGDTTPEEEKELQSYFAGDEIFEEHQVYQPMFRFFDHQRKITYPLPDTALIIKKASAGQKVISLPQTRRILIAAAAVFSIVLASWFVFKSYQPTSSNVSYVQEIEDPEEAYRITMQALAMVSGKLSKGSESIAIGMETVNKVNIIK